MIPEAFLSSLNSAVWTGILLPAVLIGGFFLTVKSRWFPLRCLPLALRETVGKLFCREKGREGSLTPFQAMTTALAGTMGTGSIVGTCQAMTLGGYGAIFWMWVAAIPGMTIKCAEVVLAVAFRRRNPAGEWVGGPMYYIRRGMGERYRFLGMLYAVFAVLASLGMGNLAQANCMTEAVMQAAERYFPMTESGMEGWSLAVGLFFSVLLGAILLGGRERVGKLTERLVPVATLIFLALAVSVILCHTSRIPWALGAILRSAFRPEAFYGAAGGITVKAAVQWGFQRCIFSNEAGLGSAAIAHSSADTDHPVRQGLFGIFEVFADTILVCTVTALAVILALPTETVLNSSGDVFLINAAFDTVFGNVSSVLVACSMVFFAFSTLLGWSVYGATCVEFLLGRGAARGYRVLFVVLSFVGSRISMETVWRLSDLFNGLMAIPNLIAVFSLSSVFLALLSSFEAAPPQKKIPKPSCRAKID